MPIDINREKVQSLMADGAQLVEVLPAGEYQEAHLLARVEEVMENGLTTFRPDNFLEALVNRMKKRKVGSVIITTSKCTLNCKKIRR
jgi:predicted transcriptional regulator